MNCGEPTSETYVKPAGALNSMMSRFFLYLTTPPSALRDGSSQECHGNTFRWSNKYVVLDCPTDMAKDIVVSHVRDVALGKRTYHYLLSGLVS